MKILTWVALAGAVSLLPAATTHAQPSIDRPAHHADDGFRNPWGLASHADTPLKVALPFFVRRIAASLVGARGNPPPIVPADKALIEAVQREQGYSLTWVGHSTFLVQMGGVRFLTDPTWSDTASPLRVGPTRFVEPGLDLNAVGHIDFVVISHNHYDHMDIGTLQALSDAGTKFYVPLANRETLLRHDIAPVVELDWWQSEMVGDAEVHCVPARHWSRRGVTDMDRALWSGWVIRVAGRTLYFAGDTGAFPGFSEIARRLGPVDLAAMPIGAYEPSAMMAPAHLNPEEAIDAVVALDARRSVAMHFGTFDLSDEALSEPPERFRAASLAAGRGPEADWVLAIGETRRF